MTQLLPYNSNRPKKYKRISHEVRMELIELVEVKKRRIKDSAKKVGLSASTARAILLKYREEGVLKQKKKELQKKKESAGKQVITEIPAVSISNCEGCQNYYFNPIPANYMMPQPYFCFPQPYMFGLPNTYLG